MISAICNKNELIIQDMGRLAYVGCVECASNKPRHTPSGVQTAVQKLARCFSRDKNFVLMGKEIWRLKLSRGRHSHTEQTFMFGVWSNLPRELHLRNAKKPLTPRTFGVLEESGVVPWLPFKYPPKRFWENVFGRVAATLGSFFGWEVRAGFWETFINFSF